MKLRLAALLAVLLAFSATPAFAQRMVTGGVKGGLNLANLAFDPEEDGCCDMKIGAAVGGFVDIGINDRLSFQPEVLFSMKGAKFSGDEEGDATANFTFIQIPMLLRANFPTSGRAQPFIVVGPGLGLRMSAKFKFDGGEEDLKDDTKSTDFSVIVGGGVKVGRATIEARYDLGLSNLNKGGEGDDGKVKTRTISVLVGFGIGR